MAGECWWAAQIGTSPARRGNVGQISICPVWIGQVENLPHEEHDGSMQIIPVIDLLGGQVVRGIGGRRSEYRPIESQLARGSDPGAIAAAFVEHFGATVCYVADLDAIERGQYQVAAWKAIADAGWKLWLDAGIGNTERRAWVSDQCCDNRLEADLVIGSETLCSEEELLRLADSVQARRMIFSLDLKGGRVLSRIARWTSLAPHEVVTRAVAAGITRIIVLDLADVGAGGGTRTLELCRRLHAENPDVELIAGGGVRSLDDLEQIARAGCNAALVASALHDGKITKADWEAAVGW